MLKLVSAAASLLLVGCASLMPDPAPEDPKLWKYGLAVGDEPRDVDPETGLEIKRMGVSSTEYGRISAEAHNARLLGDVREGRLVGKYRDRFVTPEEAATLLRTAGVVVRPGEPGVELPGTQWFVRLRGREVEGRAGRTGLFVDYAALVAFRPDGRAFLVAQPPGEAWTRCFVVDSATGVHVQTIRR
jgi:hypothetical protein